MAIKIISSTEALDARRSNESSNWPSRKPGVSKIDPIATYFQKSDLRLSLADKIFCIGSCFAREVEVSFSRLGFNVLSRVDSLPRFSDRRGGDPGFANKYTIGSILAELKNCLVAPQGFDTGFIKSGDHYVDCSLMAPNYLGSGPVNPLAVTLAA